MSVMKDSLIIQSSSDSTFLQMALHEDLQMGLTDNYSGNETSPRLLQFFFSIVFFLPAQPSPLMWLFFLAWGFLLWEKCIHTQRLLPVDYAERYVGSTASVSMA